MSTNKTITGMMLTNYAIYGIVPNVPSGYFCIVQDPVGDQPGVPQHCISVGDTKTYAALGGTRITVTGNSYRNICGRQYLEVQNQVAGS